MKHFLNRSLRKQKERALFETEKDLQYIEAFKSQELNFEEGPARRRMAELKRKEKRTAEEDVEYDNVLDAITNSKAVKDSYRGTQRLQSELRDYLTLL